MEKYTSKLKILIGVLVIFSTSGCNRTPRAHLRNQLLTVTDNVSIYYELHAPEGTYFLPYALAEISGLSFKNPNSLLAIQDEEGILYEFDLESKSVVNTRRFARPNDFEGVELVGDSVFILESDGDLNVFTLSDSLDRESEKFETGLESKNDTEGLGYDPTRNVLLIVCKADGFKDKKRKEVLVFDLSTMKLQDDPAYSISKKDLERFYEKHRNIDYEKDRFRFEPSGIAWNPLDDHFYLIASVGKLMIVLNRNGAILATYSIPASILGQPEGICFSPDGTLYISSEGDGDRGYIVKYLPRTK